MKNNPLQLDEDRILVEQLRLLLSNMSSMVIPVSMVAALMLWAFSNNSNALILTVWCVSTILLILYGYYYARHLLVTGIPFEQAHHIARMLIFQHIVNGALWGVLAWVTLGTSSLAGSILVISVIAGIAGGAVATLSPVLPVSVAFVILTLGATALKLWSMGNPDYKILGITGVLYIVTLLGQARTSSRAARSAINLRFENIELMEKLRTKTAIAEAEQRKAELANITKSKFLAAASHDLRQPIHAQGLFLDVLSRTNLTAQQHELITSSWAANEASAEMLNTLLDFSRIEAGVIEPRLQAFYLQPLLNKIEREFAPQADAKGLAYRSRETTLIAQSDPALLELIMRNLVSNAIRYTSRGGLLVVFRKRGAQVVLEIRDTGIGIEASQQHEVFREFHQLGNPERDRHKGLGLGLAIVAGLSRTLEHEFSLTSTPHRGSVFRVFLPLAITLPSSSLAQQPDKVALPNMRVLVIDDDETVRDSMLYLLRDWGCVCEAADSIEDAVALTRVNVPDAIISDYRLRAQCTGAEAIATLRTLVGNPELPALLITGDTAPERLREAHASGIPLLHKPVSPTRLYHGLIEILPYQK